MAASAAALRLLRHRPEAPPSPMLLSLFSASYSKASTAAGSLPAVCRAPLPPSLVRHYCRKVTPKRCCSTVPNTESGRVIKSLLDNLQTLKDSKKSFQDKLRCCNTVSNTKSSSIKSLLDNLKHMKDNKKSLQDRYTNMEEHAEIVHKAMDDSRNVSALFKKRSNDLKKLIAMINNRFKNIKEHIDKTVDDGRNFHALCKKPLNELEKLTAMMKKARGDCVRITAVYSRISELMDDVDFGYDIVEFSQSLIGEQFEMLREETENYRNAMRRHEELERLIVNVKKVAKVCAAVGLGGGLLLILAKLF